MRQATYLQGPRSAEDIEKEQEAKLKAKYGNMGAKKKLMPKVSSKTEVSKSKRLHSKPICMCLLQDHKFFDSADWALSKQGVKTENKQDVFDKNLEPKLEPTIVRPRRTSHLGEDEP